MKGKIGRGMAISGCLWAMVGMAVGVAQEDPFSGAVMGNAGAPYGSSASVYGGSVGGYSGIEMPDNSVTGRYGGGGSVYGGGYPGEYGDPFSSGGGRLPDPELEFVLFTSEGRTRVERGLRRDLRIMAHVLGKRLGQIDLQYRGRMATSSLPKVTIAMIWEDQAVRVLYIEGYGVVFSMDASFPLAAPEPDATSGMGGMGQAVQAEEESEWVRAQRELMGGGHSSNALPGGALFDRQFPDQVEVQLLEALKNAINLELPLDDLIVVQVHGPAQMLPVPAGSMMGGGMGGGTAGFGMGMGPMPGMAESADLTHGSVMVFRVPVSRVHAWAEDAGITVEKMAEDVEISSYIWDL